MAVTCLLAGFVFAGATSSLRRFGGPPGGPRFVNAISAALSNASLGTSPQIWWHLLHRIVFLYRVHGSLPYYIILSKRALEYPAVSGGVAPTRYSLYSALGFASFCLLSALSWLCAIAWR